MPKVYRGEGKKGKKKEVEEKQVFIL